MEDEGGKSCIEPCRDSYYIGTEETCDLITCGLSDRHSVQIPWVMDLIKCTDKRWVARGVIAGCAEGKGRLANKFIRDLIAHQTCDKLKKNPTYHKNGRDRIQ